MRRRQINQMRAAGILPPVSRFEREKWEAERAPPEPEKPLAKGACRHCGVHIGRGVHFHERACQG